MTLAAGLVAVAVLAAVSGAHVPADAAPPTAAEPVMRSVTRSVAVPGPDDVLDGLSTDHPRLFVDPAGVVALRDRVAAEPALAAWYAEVRAQALALLGEPPLTYVKSDGFRLLPVSREALRRIQVLGLVWLVDEEPAVAARAWEELAAVAAFPDWNPIHFLDVAEMTHAVALGLDWFWGALTPAQRATLRTALVDKSLSVGARVYRGEESILVSYWAVADHNWNPVVNGGLTIGALAIGDLEPALAGFVASEALKRLPAALVHYGPDGGWPEGVGYWEYATEYTVATLAALESALGTDHGLGDTPGLERTWEVPVHQTGPTGQRFNWADDGEPRFAPQVPALGWLASRYDTPGARDHQQATARPDAFDVVWWRPGASGGPLPLDRLFRGIDVATARSSWGDPDATWVAVKGGNNGFNHSQLDLGQFVLEADGVRWAVDLGKENYNIAGYWEAGPGGARWNYYRSRAEGHNTLVVDPDACEDQDPSATGEIVRWESGPSGSVAIVDLTAAYRGVPARRGVALRGRGTADEHVVVQDELGARSPADIWWFLHTRAAITLVDDGHTALLDQDGELLRARLLSPSDARFSVAEAEPLPTSPNPDGQTPNTGLRKLAVHLEGGAETTIAVVFEPGAPELVAERAVVPLEDWTVDDATEQVTDPAGAVPATPTSCDPPTTPPTTEPPVTTSSTAPSPAGVVAPTATATPPRPRSASPRFTG